MQNKTLEKLTLFQGGKDFNANSFRIPFLAKTKKGTLIAGGDVRYVDSTDYHNIDICIARSEDGGKTWQDKQIIMKNNGIMEHSRKMDGCIVCDNNTGRIFVFALSLDLQHHLDTNNNEKQSFVYVYSDDDGKTWSNEIELKHFYDKDAILFFEGPGNGIQLTDGTLVIPIQRWVENTQKHRSFANILYSKDSGETWHLGESFIDVYTSESSIVEYKENEILMSCRSPLTNARGFYITKDFGKTWQKSECHNTILEFGGCQSPIYKFKAPNGREYGVYAAVQQYDSLWERKYLTLFVTEDFINWNKVSEIINESNYGYSCITYDENRNELYILTEYENALHFYNLTCFLPAIMQNIPNYDSQAISKIHQYPTYSKGHYFNINKKDTWYKIANLKLKSNSFAFLKLNLLGFNTDTDLTIKIKQGEDINSDIQFSKNQSNVANSKENFAIILTKKEDDYYIYDVFYKQNEMDIISISIINCLSSNFDNAIFKVLTNFQDINIDAESFESLPKCLEDSKCYNI